MPITRRRFLETSAAALAFAGTNGLQRPSWAAPSPSPSGMKLGLVTYNWGKGWNLNEVIQNCEAAGFLGVELRSTHPHGVEVTLSDSERQEVRQRFADSSVEFVGPGSACEYHSPDPAEVRKNIEETKAFVKLSHDCGGSGVKVRPNGMPEGVAQEQTIEQIGKALNEVARFAADYGQEIRLEVHGFGTMEIPRIHQIIQIADHPNALICWNCNKVDLEGDGLDANFRLVQDKIATVHIHDLRDETVYPWPDLFRLLSAAQFKGWTLLEDGRIPADIPAAMKENRQIWDKLVAASLAQ